MQLLKKSLTLLLAITMVFTLFAGIDLTALAEITGSCGDNLTWDYDSSTATLTISGTGNMYSYSDKYYNYTWITSAPWYLYYNTMQTVIIHEGVTSIGDYAFTACKELTSVTIPDSVTSIGNWAFEDCTGLTSITIPDGAISIGVGAFEDCSNLNDITLSDSVSTIGTNAFYNTAWYKNQPDGLVYAGKVVYRMKGDSPSNVVLQAGTTGIADYAFSYCNQLTSITIPDSVTAIGDGAFSACPGLTNISIPNGVTSIGQSMFSYCSALSGITIPNGVTSIGDSAFEGCSKLESITIPDSVTFIGIYAFRDCKELVSVTMGNGVTAIGDGAFCDCKSLTSITIPDAVTSIGSSLFLGCTVLTGVTILGNLTSIGEYAFFECTGLTDIIIPNSVTSIGEYAFCSCEGLTSFTIPGGVTSIEDKVFYGCKGLTGIIIPDGVTSIGYQSFLGCEGLTSISIPDGVTSIGYQAFYACYELTSITIPDSLTSIGEEAFSSTPWDWNQPEDGLIYLGKIAYSMRGTCPATITLKEGTLGIAGGAFYDCEELTSIVIPESVVSIGSSAFRNCTGLTTITLPSKIASIDHSTFWGCTGLSSITIPVAVTFINMDAFSDCTGLTDVYYNGSQEQWNQITKEISYWGSALNNSNVTFHFINCDHEYGEWQVRTPATCTADGEKYRVCALCQKEETEVIPAKHTLEFVPEKAASTTEAGNTAYFRCTVCEKLFDDPYAQIEMTAEMVTIPIIDAYYTITYKLDGGKNNSANPKSYNAPGKEIVLQNPTKSGYTFKGWYSDSKLTKKVTKIAANATGNKTFYAKWAKTYTITYKLNSGTNNKSNPKSYTKIDSTITLKNPTRKGYTFKGWYSDSKFKKKVTKIASGSTGNKTLYAKWAKNIYKITYKLNSGKNNAKNPKTYTVTTATITLKNPTRKGYTFQGWYSDSKYKTKVTKITKGSTGNKTLYAKWKKK